MSQTTSKPRRRWRKVLIGLAAVIVVLVLLVALAPRLVSLGVGRSAVAGAVERHVNGTATVRELSVRWFGAQKVTGLAVTGADGKTEAEVDLVVNAGLLALLTGGVDRLDVELAGALKGEVRPDGSTSFEDLWKHPTPREAAPGRTAAKHDDVVLPPGLPAVAVRVTGFRVELSDARTPAAAVLDGLSGTIDLEPDGTTKLRLNGTTAGGSAPGAIGLTLDTSRVFDDQGRLSLDRAGVDADLALSHVPVLTAERPTELTDLHLTATSDALAGHLAIGLTAVAEIEGVGAGRLEADLAVQDPVSPGGALTLDPGRITGRVSGHDVPTALLQSTLARTPIVLARDVGPTFDVEADLSAKRLGEVSVRVDAEAVKAEFAGVVDPQHRSIAGHVFKVVAQLSPELVAAVSGLYPDRRAGVQIDLDRLSIPPQGEGSGGQLAGTAVTGTFVLQAPVAIARQAGAEPLLTLDRFTARVSAESLADEVMLGGTASIDGTEAAFDAVLSGLLAEDGSLDWAGAASKGSLALRGVQAATLARLMPTHAALIESAIEQPLDVEVAATVEAGEPRIEIAAHSEQHRVAGTVVRRGEVLRVAEGSARLTVTPQTLAAAQVGAEKPFAIAETVEVTIDSEPFDLPAEAGPLNVKGNAGLRRAEGAEPLAAVRYDLSLVGQDGAFALRRTDLRLSDVEVQRVEQVLGRAPGTWDSWLGPRGDAHLTADLGPDETTATVGADFANLDGTFTATVRGDLLSVDSGEAAVVVERDVIQSRIDAPAARRPEGRPGRPPPPRVTVAADVPLSLEVRSLRMPLALLSGRRFDPAAVSADLRLTGGPLHLDEGTQGRSTIDDLEISLRGEDLTEGLGLSVSGKVTAGGITNPGALNVTGRITNLVGDDGAFAPHLATVQMDAQASGVPTAAVDALLGWQGLLAAAVGTRIDSFKAEAKDFSRTTGTLQARVETPNGWLEAAAEGRDNALKITGKAPLEAELEITPPLRERILSRIHPLLGDIRSTKRPARAKLGGAIVPLDGNVSRLRGNVGITVGQVEFDSGSITLAMLRIFNASNTKTLPGRIEPIKAQIRDGIVSYEQFVVHVEQYTISFTGTMDLVNRTLDLHWEMPLDGLAVSITELKGKVEGISVPLWTHGTFDDYRTEFPPDFKLEEVLLKAGVRSIFDELLKNIEP
jgi:hypothetical protein